MTQKFCRVCERFARADIHDEVLQVMRVGRMTALQKPTGGVRGIVVGFVRRLVARTLAQQLKDAVQLATAPFQFALSTKAGSECIAHVAQTLTDMDANATLLSVDGIGAFDLVSRGAMMRGLMDVEGSVLPFIRQFGTPSTFWWDDDELLTHDITQGEGGEQGDALMPLLFPSVCTGLCAPSETGSFRQNACWHFWTVMADFGQTDFGQTDLGQTDFDLLCVVCCLCGVGTCFTVSWSGVSCVGVSFNVWFGPPLPLDRPKFRSFLPSLGVFSSNFGGVFEGRDL